MLASAFPDSLRRDGHAGLLVLVQRRDGAHGGRIGEMRVGIADHFGWAVAVTASAAHEVVDRRRIELVEPGLSSAPIHYESRRLDVAATTALVAEVRASVVRATSAALDEIATALPEPVIARARGWEVHLYDAKGVLDQAAGGACSIELTVSGAPPRDCRCTWR